MLAWLAWLAWLDCLLACLVACLLGLLGLLACLLVCLLGLLGLLGLFGPFVALAVRGPGVPVGGEDFCTVFRLAIRRTGRLEPWGSSWWEMENERGEDSERRRSGWI